MTICVVNSNYSKPGVFFPSSAASVRSTFLCNIRMKKYFTFPTKVLYLLVLQSLTKCNTSGKYVFLFLCVFSSFFWPLYCRQFNNTKAKVREQQEKIKRVRWLERGVEENKIQRHQVQCFQKKCLK